MATTVTGIRAAKAAGETAVVLHFQGTEPLRAGAELVGAFAGWASGSSSRPTTTGGPAGDGCWEPADAGLSRFGRALVTAMNEHRVAVDIAHGGVRTSLDAIEWSTRPVIASHANAAARLRPSAQSSRRGHQGRGRVWRRDRVVCLSVVRVGRGPADLEQLVDHAVHIAGLVGADHVGLGLDFADEGEEEYDFYGYDERHYPRPPWTWPRGMEWLDQCGDISAALRARGFSRDEVAGIMGTNFLRALTDVWGA